MIGRASPRTHLIQQKGLALFRPWLHFLQLRKFFAGFRESPEQNTPRLELQNLRSVLGKSSFAPQRPERGVVPTSGPLCGSGAFWMYNESTRSKVGPEWAAPNALQDYQHLTAEFFQKKGPEKTEIP